MRLKCFFDGNEFERVISHTSEPWEISDRDTASIVLLSHLRVFQKNQKPGEGPPGKGRVAQGSTEGEYAYLRKMGELCHSRFSNDSVITFVYALILIEKLENDDTQFVRELLVRSIKQAPFNWAAWKELSALDDAFSQDDELFLKKQELFPFYKLEKLRRMRKFKQVLTDLSKLCLTGWSYLDELEGSCYHDMRDFTSAAIAFERIRSRDRYYVGGMDEYSNCLFVLERESDLSQLAQHVC